MIKPLTILCLLACTCLAWGQQEKVVSFIEFDAPVGTLEFASIHEAGHVVCALNAGIRVTRAIVYQRSKPGVGVFWKGTTTLSGASRHPGMAVAKLGGSVTRRDFEMGLQ